MSTSYQLEKKIVLRGTITALSGLHIGGSNTGMEIGGINATVVRNPGDNKPYIPGSSLKGKMRSLIELAENTIGGPMSPTVQNGPSMDPESLGAKLFGSAIDSKKGDTSKQRPSPIIVRDGHLLSEEDFFKYADLDYTHVKTEVVIDRITSAAMPRSLERVPAGACFRMEIIVNVYNNGPSQAQLLSGLFRALVLLQDDYLGGHGTRGSGQIDIAIGELWGRSMAWYVAPDDDHPEGENLLTSIDIPKELYSPKS